jgi:signal transduction histidine kinase
MRCATRFSVVLATLVVSALSLGGCRASDGGRPSIEITRVPKAAPGGPDSALVSIEGRVAGAGPGSRIVLFARSGAWWVQPYENDPFTSIQPDSGWSNQTHPGTEYAALLVDPRYHPPARADELPNEGNGVLAIARVEGKPVFWRARWFQLSLALAGMAAVLALHQHRLHQLTKQLNVRFEERLAERTRIAQELHDTLLQGFLSASMQLHVAVDQVPDDSPAKPRLRRVLDSMGHVVEEGRNAVRGLRSPERGSDDLEQAFSRIGSELDISDTLGFRVIVEGTPRPLHPVIRDEVYRIGREALVNAFRHSKASSIEVEVTYAANHLRLLVRDNGCGIDPQFVRAGRDGHWGLSGMRERAEAVGAQLKLWSRAGAGTEVELSVPRHVAYQATSSARRPTWFAWWPSRRTTPASQEPRDREV